jgi:riboflavin kinase/FMN adenylyltransferase
VGKERYASVVYVGPQGCEKFETHLFEFDGEIYGRELEVEILTQVSGHVDWESEEQMKAKVANDVSLARDYFSSLQLSQISTAV